MAKKKAVRKYPDVSAHPVKSFFVHMLTRDIELSDAVLDLLDNCIDGIIRTKSGKITGERPYDGFAAHISFDGQTFSIADDCGGIPWRLHVYCFPNGPCWR